MHERPQRHNSNVLSILGLVFLFRQVSPEDLYDEVAFKFADHDVTRLQRHLIEEAFNDIYIKAVKRLVLTADVYPEELLGLSCELEDIDLYEIFPLPTISALYDREQASNMADIFDNGFYPSKLTANS